MILEHYWGIFWLFALTVLSCFLVFMGDIVLTAKRRSQTTIRWACLLWKYPRYSVPFFRCFWQFSSLPYRLRTMATFHIFFCIFCIPSSFLTRVSQCCQQYCSAVTVCLCRVFLCYIELHGTVPDRFLCSHWILAFLHFFCLFMKLASSFWSLRLCGDSVSLLAFV